jgi:hypothetical protein
MIFTFVDSDHCIGANCAVCAATPHVVLPQMAELVSKSSKSRRTFLTTAPNPTSFVAAAAAVPEAFSATSKYPFPIVDRMAKMATKTTKANG